MNSTNPVSTFIKQGTKQVLIRNFVALPDINRLVQQCGIRPTCLYLKNRGVTLDHALVIIKRAIDYNKAQSKSSK